MTGSMLRVILGFESLNNRQSRHIQGYVEFERSHRLSYVKRILSSAHWQRSVGSAKQNYDYCSKSKVFELIGDWNVEQRETDGNVCGLIINGLLSEHRATVKCSKEYMLRREGYDSAAKLVYSIRQQNESFKSYQNCKLSNWQFKIFQILIAQPAREVLWVCDDVGNRGKTFLCQFLRVLYNYFISDGVLCCRDLGYMLPETFDGILFDVSRSTKKDFQYEVLESAKNGYMVTGKYEGRVRNFGKVPVAVFANFLPDLTMLSADRWNIVELGKGNYAQADNVPLHSTIHTLPYVKQPALPELNDQVDVLSYLRVKLRQDGRRVPTGELL